MSTLKNIYGKEKAIQSCRDKRLEFSPLQSSCKWAPWCTHLALVILNMISPQTVPTFILKDKDEY